MEDTCSECGVLIEDHTIEQAVVCLRAITKKV